jgi:hypothetical protein
MARNAAPRRHIAIEKRDEGGFAQIFGGITQQGK